MNVREKKTVFGYGSQRESSCTLKNNGIRNHLNKHTIWTHWKMNVAINIFDTVSRKTEFAIFRD